MIHADGRFREIFDEDQKDPDEYKGFSGSREALKYWEYMMEHKNVNEDLYTEYEKE